MFESQQGPKPGRQRRVRGSTPQRDPPGEPEPPVPTEIRGVMTTLAVKTLEGAAIAERSIGPPPVKR